MIKRWQKFNESNSVDNFRSEVEKIRSYFVEFEDENAISYEMNRVDQYSENDMCWSINPNTGNFDNWLNSLTNEASYYFNYPLRVSFCFCANIKLKGEKDTKYFGSNCHLSEEGVDMLENLIVTYKRLKDNYDKVVIDLNSNHSEYKPATIKVYFNPIVD